jgi:hypothetical protein
VRYYYEYRFVILLTPRPHCNDWEKRRKLKSWYSMFLQKFELSTPRKWVRSVTP